MSVRLENTSVSKNALKHSYTVESSEPLACQSACWKRWRVGVCVSALERPSKRFRVQLSSSPCSSARPPCCQAKSQRTAKKGQRKRATSKKRQKSSKSVKNISTVFDNFRAGQKTSKIVKKCQKYFRHFSTIFARHQFSGPFWGALKKVRTPLWHRFSLGGGGLSHDPKVTEPKGYDIWHLLGETRERVYTTGPERHLGMHHVGLSPCKGIKEASTMVVYTCSFLFWQLCMPRFNFL